MDNGARNIFFELSHVLVRYDRVVFTVKQVHLLRAFLDPFGGGDNEAAVFNTSVASGYEDNSTDFLGQGMGMKVFSKEHATERMSHNRHIAREQGEYFFKLDNPFFIHGV